MKSILSACWAMTLVLNLTGPGIGLTDESPDFSLRTGVVWRF